METISLTTHLTLTSSLANEIERLREQCNSIQELKDSCEKLDAMNQDLRTAKEEVNDANKNLNEELAAANAQIANLKEQIDSLTAQVAEDKELLLGGKEYNAMNLNGQEIKVSEVFGVDTIRLNKANTYLLPLNAVSNIVTLYINTKNELEAEKQKHYYNQENS